MFITHVAFCMVKFTKNKSRCSMDDYVLNRECIYLGVEYKIVQVLGSDTLLVVKKEDFDKGSYPMQPLIIPGR